LTIVTLRTGKRFPSTRPLTSLYSKAFLIAAIIWFVSAFVPPPIRFVLWIMALALDISTTLVFTRRLSKRFAPHIYHLPDRFGTFAIIVLGITILAFVDNIATHNWTFPSIFPRHSASALRFAFGGYTLTALIALLSRIFEDTGVGWYCILHGSTYIFHC